MERIIRKRPISNMSAIERSTCTENTAKTGSNPREGLCFDHISFSYFEEADPVLKDLSIHFRPGKISLITGPSGCGKSTLLFLAAGLYPENGGYITSGEIRVKGNRIQDMSPEQRARTLRMVFQNADLQFCFHTVSRELIFSMETANLPPESMPRRAKEALSAVRLDGFGDRLITTLSGGEKQRLALACQLVSGAEWLLLDEIFNQVDPEQTEELATLLLDLKNRYDLSLLVVDHDLRGWEGKADDYYLFDAAGNLLADPAETKTFTSADWNRHGVIARGSVYPPPARGSLSGASPARSPIAAIHTERKENRLDSDKLLTVKDLSVSYGDRKILDKLSFSLERGRVYALTGRSGVGKSTLFEALAGFLPKEARCRGQIAFWEGIKAAPRYRLIEKRISLRHGEHPIRFIFQNPQDQFVADTVAEEVLFSLRRSIPEDAGKREEIATLLLKRNDLWKVRRYAPFQLSEGQQRRLAVVSLLTEKTDLLLCDEPCYAQDYRRVSAIMDMLTEAASERGTTVMFTTHDMTVARHYADVVLTLEGPSELRENRDA